MVEKGREWYKMANPKITVSLSQQGIAVLNKLVETTGLKKAALVQLALEKYLREEVNRNGEKVE